MAGVIAALPTHQFENNGEPVSGGSVTVYAANTVTPANTWQDQAQTTLNTNPIVLDAQGRCVIWLTAGQLYDFVVKDSLGATLYTIDDVYGQTSSSQAVSEWLSTGIAPTFVSPTSFTLVGNQTSIYTVGRRIRAAISSGSIAYGTVTASTFSSVTTVTAIMDSIALDAGLSSVDVGIISYANTSLAILQPFDLSSYSGADIPLGVGQKAKYTLSSVSSLSLRIATATDQCYRITCNFNFTTGSTPGSNILLQINNAALGAASCNNLLLQSTTSSAASSLFLTNDFAFNLNGGAKAFYISSIVHTRTAGKMCNTEFLAGTAFTSFLQGYIKSNCSNTSTVWTSLGTLNLIDTYSGTVLVERLF